MNEFRCRKCRQLQFKYKLKGDRLDVEVKCYNDNTFNYFTIWLNKKEGRVSQNTKKQNEINNKRK